MTIIPSGISAPWSLWTSPGLQTHQQSLRRTGGNYSSSGCLESTTWTTSCWRPSTDPVSGACWCSVGLSVVYRKKLQRLVDNFGQFLPTFYNTYNSRCLTRLRNIVMDSSHLSRHLLDLLPSGKCYRCFKSRTNRLRNCLISRAITFWFSCTLKAGSIQRKGTILLK